MLAGQRPKDDHSTVHVDTTPTCAQTHMFLVRTSQCTVHSSNTHALAQGTMVQCRVFLKNIVMPSSCLCQVCLSLVPPLLLHLLLVLCHDLQRHRHHWRAPLECLLAWPIRLYTHEQSPMTDESGVQERTNPDQAAKGEPEGVR